MMTGKYRHQPMFSKKKKKTIVNAKNKKAEKSTYLNRKIRMKFQSLAEKRILIGNALHCTIGGASSMFLYGNKNM
jgi:hypothetical protein